MYMTLIYRTMNFNFITVVSWMPARNHCIVTVMGGAENSCIVTVMGVTVMGGAL